jgi:hypothetical protein
MKTTLACTLICAACFLCFNSAAQTGVSEKKTISLKKPDDKQLRGTSDPLKGLDISEAEKQLEIGDYYALIIGIDKYSGSWTPLQNAVRDARTVETTLRASYKFDHFYTLYDEDATRENIHKAMSWLMGEVEEKDNVLIYFSGHGDYKQQMNKGFWVPVDAGSKMVAEMISNNDISAYLTGINSRHTLLVSDACFSGDIFRGDVLSVEFEESDRYYREVNSLLSRKALTSGGLEPVMDGGKDGHSIFTYYMLKALTSNKNKYFDATELYNDIKIPVTNNSDQRPRFAPIKDTGDEGGQFIFIKK